MKSTVIKSILALLMAFITLPMMGQDFMNVYFKNGGIWCDGVKAENPVTTIPPADRHVYSTVNASVREVRVTEMKEVTLGQRIVEGFQNSLDAGAEFLEDMVIFLVSALPWLIAVAVVLVIVRLIVRKVKRNKRKAFVL